MGAIVMWTAGLNEMDFHLSEASLTCSSRGKEHQLADHLSCQLSDTSRCCKAVIPRTCLWPFHNCVIVKSNPGVRGRGCCGLRG